MKTRNKRKLRIKIIEKKNYKDKESTPMENYFERKRKFQVSYIRKEHDDDSSVVFITLTIMQI